MEYDNTNVEKQSLNLKSIPLDENGGGEQMIFAHKPINDKEYFVFTLGNGPKQISDNNQTTVNHDVKNTESNTNQFLSNIRGHIPGLNKNSNQNAIARDETSKIKLRCFKLSQVEGEQYLVEEYVNPKTVSDVARFMVENKNDSERNQ